MSRQIMEKLALVIIFFIIILSADLILSYKDSNNKGTEEKMQLVGTNEDMFVWDGTKIKGLTGEGRIQTKLVIPDKCTAISKGILCQGVATSVVFEGGSIDLSGVFSDMETLVSVELPNDTAVIGDDAFRNCKALSRISLPASVSEIGDSAFLGCSSLKNINLGDCAIKKIQTNAFRNAGLEGITIPDGTEEIGKYAFYGCVGITSVYIPDSVRNLHMNAFGGTSMEKATFGQYAQFSIFDYNAFGDRSGNTTVYIKENSWMDNNRYSWNIEAFKGVLYY